jgi:hypothetical protein
VRVYIATSEDLTMSTNRGDDRYWKLVEKNYNTLLTENMDDEDVVEIRSFGALKSRYKKALQKDCALYARFYKTIKDANQSGKSEEYDDGW